MTRSRRLAAVALSGAVALTCALPITPAQAVESPVGTVRLSTEKRQEIRYVWAGSSGFRYGTVGGGSTTWVDYPGVVPPAHAGPDDLATGADVVTTMNGATATQKHRSTGVTATLTIPSGQTYQGAVGWSVLTRDGSGALHVLRAAPDGTTTDLPVSGLPAGAQPTAYPQAGSVRRLAVVHRVDGTTSVGLIDLADGTFRTYITGLSAAPEAVYNDRWLVADWKAIRIDSEPGTEPSPVAGLAGRLEAVVGDQVLAGNPDFVTGGTQPALNARSLVTGAASTVLSSSFGGIGPTLDGGALATAGTSSLDWNVHRITPTEDGTVTTEKVAQIPAYAVGVEGLAVAGGELFLYGSTPGASSRFSSFRWTPRAGPRAGRPRAVRG